MIQLFRAICIFLISRQLSSKKWSQAMGGIPLPTSLVVFVFVFVTGHGRVPPSPHHLVDWHEAASTAANGDKIITIVIVCSSWETIFLFNSRPQKKEYQGVATSKLLYVPDITDDGHYLTCRSPRIISLRLKQKIFCQTVSYHIITGC